MNKQHDSLISGKIDLSISGVYGNMHIHRVLYWYGNISEAATVRYLLPLPAYLHTVRSVICEFLKLLLHCSWWLCFWNFIS